jgi:hypothetical protein
VLVSVGLAALVLGSALVENPGFVIPLFIESVALLVLTLWLLGKVRDVAQRGFLIRVLGVAAVLRAVVIGAVYGVLSPMIFAPDTGFYRAMGIDVARYWAGTGLRPEILDRWQIGYVYLNGAFARLLDDPTWAMVVLNTFVAFWTVILAYLLARACFGVVAARITAVLAAVFPSMVLWSVLNIRDAVTTMVVTAVVLLGVRIYQDAKTRDVVFLLIGVLALSTLRDYMLVLVLAGLLLGFVSALRPGRVGSTLVGGVIVVLILLFALEQSETLTREQLEAPLRSASSLRQGLQVGAGSAFGVEYSIETPGDAIRYLPVGLAYFLFAPFPWTITSALQAFTLPEVLLWYALVPFLVIGLGGIVRRDSAASMLLIGVLVVTVSSYALVEGNFGTAYRHRAQVMPLFFVFISHGLALWWAKRKARMASEQRRALEARMAVLPRRPSE